MIISKPVVMPCHLISASAMAAICNSHAHVALCAQSLSAKRYSINAVLACIHIVITDLRAAVLHFLTALAQ